MFSKDILKNHSLSYHRIAYVALGVFILFLTSQLYIPLKPVPITLQTFGVMLIALCLPKKQALHSVIAFIALGLAGAPVFKGFSGGAHILFGTTGGYLVGFVVAVFIMATLKEKVLPLTSGIATFMNCILGSLCIYAFGVTWLAYLLGSFSSAIHAGFFPFVIPGMVKAFLLSGTLKFMKKEKISS